MTSLGKLFHNVWLRHLANVNAGLPCLFVVFFFER